MYRFTWFFRLQTSPRVGGHCLHGRVSFILKSMEVHFSPETEKKLNDLAAQGGRGTADELVQDLVEGYIGEIARTREMLNSRYNDLKSGKVKPIPRDEVEAHFREKSAAARRSQQPGS
jgi:Arc/MetJ-type ribon-helix-helix transcriptional regulator